MKTYMVFVSQHVYVQAESEEQAQQLAIDLVEKKEWLCECIEASDEEGNVEIF